MFTGIIGWFTKACGKPPTSINTPTYFEGDHGVDYAAILSVHSHVIVLFKPLSAPLSSAIWA